MAVNLEQELKQANRCIAELKSHLQACSDTCGFQAKQIERLRGWLEKIAEEDSFGGDHSVALAKAALREDEDELD